MSDTTTRHADAPDASDASDDDERAHEDGPFACPYCDRAFNRADYRHLHLGLDHEGELTDAEREAYERAREEEERELALFRYKALGLLVLIYFGFLMAYAFSL